MTSVKRIRSWLARLLVGVALLSFAPSLARAQDGSDAVVKAGAGARDYGRPLDDGGIRALSPIEGNDRAVLDQKDAALEGSRWPAPLVLADDEIKALLAARGGPSVTIGTGVTGVAENFETATRLVNDFVKTGEKLTLERIDAINKALLTGTDNQAQAGVTRDKSDWHHYDMWTHKDFGAAPTLVKSYLADFMTWYDAAEARGMAPVELAAAAYQQLVRIHPYVDANGRTTRLVMDWILQKHGLPPATFDAGSKSYEAIFSSTADLAKNTADAVLAAEKKLAEIPTYVARLGEAKTAAASAANIAKDTSQAAADPGAGITAQEMAKIRARGTGTADAAPSRTIGIDGILEDATKGARVGDR